MKDIVIVGAGPVGLYAAALYIKVINKYHLPITVTIIDPHAGNYRRERIVSNQVIEDVSSEFNLDIPKPSGIPVEAMYIRDLERTLYDYCLKSGVTIQQGTFQSLGKNKVKYTTSKGVSQVACDLVMDFSGNKRVVINEVNRQKGPTALTISQLGNNPVPQHFSRYINLTPDEAKKLSSGKKLDPIKQARELIKLRQTFEWPYFTLPDIDIRSAVDKDNSVNFFIYYEALPALKEKSKSVQLAFFKTILKLKYGFDEIDFTVKSHGDFIVNPHMVEKGFYQMEDNNLLVVAGGDAEIEPDYRKGFGIEMGFNRLKGLFQSTTFKPDGFELDLSHYNLIRSQLMAMHKQLITSLYQSRQREIKQSNLPNAKLYYLALADNAQGEEARTLAEELKLLGNAFYGINKYADAKECYRKAVELYQSLSAPIPNTLLNYQSNLALAYLSLKDYDSCIASANDAIKTFFTLGASDKNLFYKALFRKSTALLAIIDSNMGSSSKTNIGPLLEDLKETHQFMVKHCGDMETTRTEQIAKRIAEIELTMLKTGPSPTHNNLFD
ncbi:hypothetical protein [Legionella sp. W05-934-2]|jgi:hypothetical protein|uniref:hypothetical protein n=1 Tax=Legionella sp. W05-934-2 TaxID=1198649 RepID=UPI0034622C25